MNSVQYDKSLLKACGENTRISASVEIRRPHLVSVGKHTAVDSGFYLTTAAEIGDYIHIGPYVTIIGGATGMLVMEHFASIATGSRIICGSDEHKGYGMPGPTIPKPYQDKLIIEPVIFRRFANVTTNVVIVPGVTLAEGTVVGACSLVMKDTEPWGIYFGVPAKKVGERPREKILQYAKELGY